MTTERRDAMGRGVKNWLDLITHKYVSDANLAEMIVRERDLAIAKAREEAVEEACKAVCQRCRVEGVYRREGQPRTWRHGDQTICPATEIRTLLPPSPQETKVTATCGCVLEGGKLIHCQKHENKNCDHGFQDH